MRIRVIILKINSILVHPSASCVFTVSQQKARAGIARNKKCYLAEDRNPRGKGIGFISTVEYPGVTFWWRLCSSGCHWFGRIGWEYWPRKIKVFRNWLRLCRECYRYLVELIIGVGSAGSEDLYRLEQRHRNPLNSSEYFPEKKLMVTEKTII
ncbi:uncharacterized protein LOC129742322 [Uranotaenia lowii]|uniref:uncharacterized protein LOC129742322 n=1 Tax=Uranotaenia lowii TaxID=190385 RepID=UPI0024786299|nr:uncharacterized protein LOC129742322 [Uranotaenia lowii]